METIDFTRQYRDIYTARKGMPRIVEVPELQYLMFDGTGEPGNERFLAGIQALYSVSYPVRFAIKQRDRIAYKVMPLQGLWGDPQAGWEWTLMIMQPDFVTKAEIDEGVEAALAKGVAAAAEVRLERFTEGRCAQVMHVGPYSEEEPTIALLHDYIAEHGLAPSGLHHEIYLGDPNRSKPENLKTIIRRPVVPA